MKVRVTYEIDDTDRIAINVLQNGEFKPADRATIEILLTAIVEKRLTRLRERFALATNEIMGGMDVNTEEENQ